jgi:hypothetical protein
MRVTIFDFSSHLASFSPNAQSYNPTETFLKPIDQILNIHVLKKCVLEREV